MYTQLGQHNLRLDHIEASLEAFRRALEIAETLKTPENIQTVYVRLCTYYAEIQENELASLYAYKSTQLQNQQIIKQQRSGIYHHLGHVILRTRPEQTRAFIDNALNNHHVQQDPLALASITTLEAEWYFKQDQPATALTYAEQAQQLATKAGDTLIEAEALIVLGRINYALGQPEEGARYFTTGLDMLERLGNHEELADKSVHYAQLLEDLGQEREAFTHFRRAFQSRQKLGK